ncbi:MAG: hypothetical protein KAV87_24620 [Desulfobacteraceae bacterium]|nr:hypothetical protein [Desulfobacteraceae bacterium]
MEPELLVKVVVEEKRGIRKWGAVDRSPVDLLVAALEELGEVAHAVNHNEGKERVRQEIAEVIGILSRLDAMVWLSSI